MGLRFLGDFDELQRILRELKYSGEWKELEHGAQFRAKDGAILNWFHKNGTIMMQGPTDVKDRLESKLRAVLEEGALEVGEPDAPPAMAAAEPAKPEKKTATVGSKRVFVVHGHDEVAREQLELVLRRLHLDPFVLADTGGGGMTIIEALEKETGPRPGRCRFGIVLMTPDDIGYAKEEGPDKAEPRARQNVVLEMGMLIAALRRKNVAILKKGHLKVPSDVDGIIYIPFNEHVKETVPKLVLRLRDAGFDLDQKDIGLASS